MKRKSLYRQQLNSKMLGYAALNQVPNPPIGWIKAIRNALGMTMQQLGNKLNISKQAVHDIEKREMEGSITIKSLREIARVMDMQLVYGFVPVDGTLDALIEKRAKQLATEIVMRSANTMKLENQSISEQRVKYAIEERTASILNDMPKMLWD
jgi:predicted DNA-binding mobile mystery protein A